MTRNWATIPQYARFRRQNERTIRNYVGKGYFPVYRLRGFKGVVVDVDEAEAALAKVPSAQASRNYGQFGPDAKVIDLSNVVMSADSEADQ